MRISTQHKFVYISTPKACTHSIYRVLEKHYSRGLLQHGFHDVQIPSQYQDYFRWTVCRNPYSRAVSLWWSGCRLHPPDQYKFREGCGASDDFTRFVVWLSETEPKERLQEPLMMNQTSWLRLVEPIKAIHMEELEEGLRELPFWKPGIKIPQLNTTVEKLKVQSLQEGQTIEKPPWQDMYQDNEARDAVLEWAGDDFERFGYEREL